MNQYSPGFHPNIPFEEYLSIPAISKSDLDAFRASPAEYKRGGHKEKTSSMQLGTLAHQALIEPEIFKAYPEKKKKLKTYEKAAAMAERLLSQEVRLLVSGAEYEVTMIWIDPITKLTCKGRWDILRRVGRAIDYKTISDLGKFDREAKKRRYHVQAAFYSWGFQVLMGFPIDMFAFIAQETKPPYGIEVRPVSHLTMAGANAIFREDLNDLALAMEKDAWPEKPIVYKLLEI